MDYRHRLLCLFPWLAIGGADKFNLDMLRELRACGWRATVVAMRPGDRSWRAEFERLADVVDLGVWPPDQRPARLLAVAAAVRPAALLISNSTLGYDLLPYLRAHLPETALVDYNHMQLETWRDGGYPRASLDYAAALDLQIVSSAHLRGWMLARRGEPGRIHVCYTGVDAADWDPAAYDRAALRRDLGLGPDDLVVLFTGRLEAQKQPVLLAQVIGAVCRSEPRARFLIAGDGAYAGFLRAFLRRRGLSRRAIMLGSVENRRVRELLALSDVFLLPSAYEGIALAIYEAMAMGVVPVSAQVGGQAELVTPTCGVLVPHGPGERAAYVSALRGLAGDPARLRSMGLAARRRVAEHFSLAQMGAIMARLLEQAAELRHSSPRPPVTPAQALDAARLAVANARAEESADAVYHESRGPRGLARRLYQRLVAMGAWWLVPLVERARGGKEVC